MRSIEWILESLEISRTDIYSKYPTESMLLLFILQGIYYNGNYKFAWIPIGLMSVKFQTFLNLRCMGPGKIMDDAT